MKKSILFLIICLFVVSNMKSQTPAYYQAQGMSKANGYNIGTEQYGTASQGNTVYSWLDFNPGDYMILALSDDSDVKDVDIFVYDEYGNLVIKDADDSPVAAVAFHCDYYKRYKVVMKNYKSNDPNYASILRFYVAYK